MRNFIKFILFFSLIVGLASCWDKEEVKEDALSKTTVESSSDANSVEIDISEDKEGVIKDWDEYSFNLSVKDSTGLENDSTYYKKWDKKLIVINKIVAPGLENMPMEIWKVLFTDWVVYQNMTVKWKEYWTKDAWDSFEFYNLKELSSVPTELISETKEEEVQWKKMTCHYYKDEESAWKWCLFDWVFMYWETTLNEWWKMTMIISEFTKRVDDDLFVWPKEEEVSSMEEVWSAMMWVEWNMEELMKMAEEEK